MLSESTRAYVYRVLTGVGLVAIFYGAITGAEAAVWGALAATVLQTAGNGMAAVNTSTKNP